MSINRAPEDERFDGASRFRQEWRWRAVVAAVGFAATTAGGVSVFVTTNGTGSAALIAMGAVCIVLAALWDRVKTVKGGGVEVELVQVAQRKLDAAKAADSRGDRSAAALLRAEADELLTLARPWAAEYEHVRGSLPSGPRRTALMEESVARARETAETRRAAGEPIDPRDVRAVFTSGNDGARVTALGFMQGDPDAVDLDIVLDVIGDSRSAFEQAHAFAVADEVSRRQSLEPASAKRLLDAAEAALATDRVQRSRSRRDSAESIVRRLQETAPPN